MDSIVSNLHPLFVAKLAFKLFIDSNQKELKILELSPTQSKSTKLTTKLPLFVQGGSKLAHTISNSQ
jgi:hypothetical protein